MNPTCTACEAPPTYPSASLQNLRTTSFSTSSPSISYPASTFPLFTHLPPELRLKIWSLSLPPPRLVPLNYLSSTSPITSTTPKEQRGCTSTSAIPVTLHICHESRTLALRHYSLSFGLSGGPFYSKVYFGVERGDVLYFGEKKGLNASLKAFVNVAMMVLPSELKKVRTLAVSERLFWKEGLSKGAAETNLRHFWERVQRKFTGLEEVLFVSRAEDPLLALEEREDLVEESVVELLIKGLCYANGELGFSCWEEERFEEKVERVVRNLEKETGWAAPKWRVLGRRLQNRDRRMESSMVEAQARKEREADLVGKMRVLFGHEDVSNAV